MTSNKGLFKSKDFFICCVLRASNFNLRAVESTSEKFANFIFDDPENRAKEVIRKHWNGELKLSTKSFVETISEMKTRLRSGV